jgi:hypothetical protein
MGLIIIKIPQDINRYIEITDEKVVENILRLLEEYAAEEDFNFSEEDLEKFKQAYSKT